MMLVDSLVARTTILHLLLQTRDTNLDIRFKLINYILSAAPDAAARSTNSRGCLPLHFALNKDNKLDIATRKLIVKRLVEVFPEGVMTASDRGLTPLHLTGR